MTFERFAPLPARRVGETLARATVRLHEAGSETARLDAEVLLGHVLRVERSTLAAHPEAVLSDPQAESFERCLERRSQGEPVAYIRGLKEFWGAALVVDERVLIPRPETETLVDLAVTRVRSDLTSSPRAPTAGAYLVWDVATGSGAVAVAMGLELRRRRYGDAVRFIASDVSADALAVATINVVSHGLADIVDVREGDLADPSLAPRPVDLLTANLPYIPSSDIPGLPVAASFEPRHALDGGPDGLDLVRRLLAQLPTALDPDGVAFLEIGSDQPDAMQRAVAASLPGWECHIHPDLGGRPRVAEVARVGALFPERATTGPGA
jgi:release factor glutamine methyltransferase